MPCTSATQQMQSLRLWFLLYHLQELSLFMHRSSKRALTRTSKTRAVDKRINCRERVGVEEQDRRGRGGPAHVLDIT